jgi:dTDP-4-amino-4,6-dideoxygalactose transaminase
MEYLQKWTDARIKVADYYFEHLADANITLPVRQSFAKAVYHQFVIRHDRRDELKAHLKEQGIASGIHYPIALPKLAAYKHMGLADKKWQANELDSKLLSLPIGEHLSEEDLAKVVAAVKSFG